MKTSYLLVYLVFLSFILQLMNISGCTGVCEVQPKETVELPSDKHCRDIKTSVDQEESGHSCRNRSPRCKKDDKKCLPLPYSGYSYQSDKQRKPIESNPQASSNGCLNRGSCEHDGECLTNGCGNHCTSYKVPAFGGICPGYHALEKAFCGCVMGRCTWFTQ